MKKSPLYYAQIWPECAGGNEADGEETDLRKKKKRERGRGERSGPALATSRMLGRTRGQGSGGPFQSGPIQDKWREGHPLAFIDRRSEIRRRKKVDRRREPRLHSAGDFLKGGGWRAVVITEPLGRSETGVLDLSRQ